MNGDRDWIGDSIAAILEEALREDGEAESLRFWEAVGQENKGT